VIGTEEALLGGVPPQFVVDVSAAGASYRGATGASSINELTGALRAAATYKSSMAPIVVAIAVAAVVAIYVQPWLIVAVAIGGLIVLLRASHAAIRSRRVAVVYRMDDAAARAFQSLSNGFAWLIESRAVWRITDEESVQRPANTTSVTRVAANLWRGDAANVLTNIGIPSITGSGETLHFLPDALLVRDAASNVVDLAYQSLRIECQSMLFSESAPSVPSDSKAVSFSWLYANKDGSPDRRRSGNRQIPVLEYTHVVLSWRSSDFVLLVSNATAARHFVNALQAMAQFRGAKAAMAQPQPIPEKKMLLPMQRPPAPSTDLERTLQASIERKRRLDELERAARAVVVQADARDRREELPRGDNDAQWIPRGGSVTVQGYATGDLVFVGRRLTSLDGFGVEPSLIDPARTIEAEHPNTSGGGIDYWPSYSKISPASRAAYLQWLAGGRRDPEVYIGYVFIFFYGLERRVYELIRGGAATGDEALAIAQEVARLLDQHATRSHSFGSYAESFLDLIASIEPRARGIHRSEIRPGFGVPLRLKVALGELALAAKPVPASLALDWVRAVHYLNTPATRCAREFELLFHIRYARQFGDGMVIKPNKTTIDFTYRSASASLGTLSLKERDVPDVTQLARPLAKLVELTHECEGALDPFSRFLGKNAGGRDSLAAFATLPEELVEAAHSADAQSLASLVQSRLDGEGQAHFGAGEILPFVRLSKPDKVSKNEATLLAQALEKLGYGIEPDVRLGGPVLDVDGRVIVFRRLSDCPSAPSDECAAAMLLVRLGALVSAADDVVSQSERERLEQHIEERLHLTAGERQRLTAHLSWVLEADLGMTGLKRRLEELPQQARRAVGGLLIEIAMADGHIDPREMKLLEKLYALLQIPAADLYRDVHVAHTIDDEPVIVDQPAQPAKTFAIPPLPATTPTGLDMSRVRLKIAETRQVSALLSSIFTEEDETRSAPALAAAAIGSLDGAHSEFLRRLAERESWPRDEVERLAAELSLMPDGALETINDYAYATLEEPFWEDGDPVAINVNVAMELIR
jgi:uncharacterized tellurite resistance protein B-like protein